MKFHLVAQCEISYLKNNKGDIVRKFYAPAKHFFIPGTWEYEQFPDEMILKTWTGEELRAYLNNGEESSSGAK